MDDIWLEIEQATKDFDFESIKSKAMSLPDDQGRALEPIKNVRGLMKSFIDAQKMIGDSSNRLPKDDDAAGWEKFYQKRGKPESADKYEFNLNEYELPEDLMGDITKGLFEANLTNKQANQVLKTFLDLTKADVDKATAAREKQLEEYTKQKQVRFGDKLGEAENLAKALMDKIESEGVKNGLKELMATADGLEFLSNMAAKSTGDNPNPSNKQPPRGVKTAKEQIEALKADKDFLNKIFQNDMSVPLAERQRARQLWQDLHVTAANEK